jgi:hypothetical protein
LAQPKTLRQLPDIRRLTGEDVKDLQPPRVRERP